LNVALIVPEASKPKARPALSFFPVLTRSMVL
jgi:hypothetical protein